LSKYEKFLDALILLLLGILGGFNIFFTFIVAPLLFSNFNHKLAGEITNVIFPYYFASGWVIGVIIYTLIAIKSLKNKNIVKNMKIFIVGVALLVILHMALHKTILPIGQKLNTTYYELLDQGKEKEAQLVKNNFKKLHVVSSIINFANLAIILYLFIYFYLRSTKKENC
jgi:hypothetical protein